MQSLAHQLINVSLVEIGGIEAYIPKFSDTGYNWLASAYISRDDCERGFLA